MIIKVNTKELKDSMPVENCGEILTFLCDNITESYKAQRKPLSSYYAPELRKHFDKPNLTKTLEFRYSIYVLQYEDLIFNIFSNSTKGTCIEVCDITHEDISKNKDKIIAFLKELDALLFKK